MNTYFVLFAIPAAAIAEWMANVDEATRKEQSEKIMKEWQDWMSAHESAIVDKGRPIGKTKHITADGVSDAKNDLNWYLLVQAESHEAAAEMFVGHPHLQIPTSYIEVMESARPGM